MSITLLKKIRLRRNLFLVRIGDLKNQGQKKKD
jgi:hypothetical protein